MNPAEPQSDTPGAPGGGAAPVFVLVAPQLGENIGACARVMGNFAIPELRIVAPRDGWPNPAAETMAAGSGVLANAQVFDTLEAAVADCHRIYATTGTPRHMVKPVVTARAAMGEIRASLRDGQRAAIMFGAEKSGHSNEEIARARAVITLPVDPDFTSLNLAMACGVLAYEWRAGDGVPDGWKPMEGPATQGELDGLYAHLQDELDRAGFFYPPEKTPLMMQNLINIFARGGLSQQEVRTLRGAIKALTIGRGKARVVRTD
ncbi:MAG: RNA methyltransferase [Alphaproteobacteria bacterium]|nr:RNA methyltransferase [Alphaproteobacteria bacterium]